MFIAEMFIVCQGDGQRARSIYIKYVIPEGAAAQVSFQLLYCLHDAVLHAFMYECFDVWQFVWTV